MQFFTAALLTLSALSTAVLAQENPLTYPSAGDKIVAGTTIEIKWTPTTSDKEITLVLRDGESDNLNILGPIVESTENDGSYTWSVPEDLVASTDYAIEIKYSSGVNYSPQFEIESTVTEPTTTTTTATTAATTTTESETETETETATAESTTTEDATTTTVDETTILTLTTTSATVTSYPNTTLTTSTTATTTTTSKPRTTSNTETTGAPDPNSAAGLGKMVSGGLVMLVAATWAMML